MDRRDFINSVAITSAITSMGCHTSRHLSQGDSWSSIADLFENRHQKILNFNTGSASMMPISIRDAYKVYVDKLSNNAPYQVLLEYDDQRKQGLTDLCQLVGAAEGSIRMVRNTTEAINAILHSFPFNKDDEIIVSDVDYPHMVQTTKLLQERKGVVLSMVNIKNLKGNPDAVINAFQEKVNSKTKFMVITYMTHRSGHILPAKKLCALARENNVRTFVDGAHIVGQLDVNMEGLDCDYFGSSLHKWLYAPLGTGMLYIKPGLSEELQPAYSYRETVEKSIDKFNSLGTIAFQNYMCLKDVLAFHHSIGTQKKYERLKYLNKRLIDGVKSMKNYFLRSFPEHSCAISAIAHVSAKPSELKKNIQSRHNIHIKNSGFPGMYHLRSSVNLHMEEQEVDRLLNALEDVG